MDVNTYTSLIGSLGFPIVMCIMMYVRMGKQDGLHQQEMDKLTESLNNNTVAITKLATKLGQEEE